MFKFAWPVILFKIVILPEMMALFDTNNDVPVFVAYNVPAIFARPLADNARLSTLALFA